MTQTVATIPDNVPPELVVDFDFYRFDDSSGDVHLNWARLHAGPDIVWTPHYGGYWIATRGEDIDAIQRDYEHFSHRHFNVPADPAGPYPIPISMDPPQHTIYRRLLMQGFTPKKVAAYVEIARQTAQELMKEIAPRGECEFVSEFGKVLPINVFLTMMGLPLEDRPWLLERAEINVRSPDAEVRNKSRDEIAGYVLKHIAERKKNRGDDLLSMIVYGEIDGRPINDREILLMSLTVMTGGLDTVASQMAFAAHFLAQNPGHRKELRENPALIPVAIEEFLRRHGLANSSRELTMDYEYKGIKFKKGDMIQIPKTLYGLDDRLNSNPAAIDFHRQPTSIKHVAFGSGPHLCPGNVLARRELGVFLEEWLKNIPDFSVDPERPPEFASGLANGVNALYLKWNV